MMTRRSSRRAFLAPEVVQTSNMDCGPAVLKALCQGFGLDVNYGRLREACQTDIDGTSIGVLEDLAGKLGLDAEQVLVPEEHVFLAQGCALPAIVVTTISGTNHFVVIWRRIGPWVQLMDPAFGRRWVRIDRFRQDLLRHEMLVPAAEVRTWIGSSSFIEPLLHRLEQLGLALGRRQALVDHAMCDPTCRSLAALDAAARMVERIAGSGSLKRGPSLAPLVERLASSNVDDASIPNRFWRIRPAAVHQDGEAQTYLRGTVAVQIKRRIRLAPAEGSIPEGLLQTLREGTESPWHALVRLLREAGRSALAAVLLAMFVSAGAVCAQAVVLRSLFDLAPLLTLGSHRLAAAVAILALVLAVVLLRGASFSSLLRVGRRLELQLRIVLLKKIPRIHDRYFQSRTVSDMAERAHSTSLIRSFPLRIFGICGDTFQLLFMVAGIVWLAPWAGPQVVVTGLGLLAISWIAHPWLLERDRRARVQAGGLTGHFLEAFLGSAALAAHGARNKLLQKQEALLVRWAHAQLETHRMAMLLDGVQTCLAVGLAWWLVFSLIDRPGHEAKALLLAYWALQLSGVGQALVASVRRLPALLNATERILEPLTTPEETHSVPDEPVTDPCPDRGPSIVIDGVTVTVGGNTLFEHLHLSIPAGSHVALVGESGSGKSTLLGLLLGWHQPTSGEVRVDGAVLSREKLASLRQQTAWIDPSVQLWNRSLLENLSYQADSATEIASGLGRVVETTELQSLLQRLPNGLQSKIGEGGVLVSGGEGQRVRFARTLLRRSSRLVIMDEPFRGLDHDQRKRLLACARARWPLATLLCATHDIGETLAFDRVLVVESGKVVEDGDPKELALTAGSRFADALCAEDSVRRQLWADGRWRRLRVDNGSVTETPSTVGSALVL